MRAADKRDLRAGAVRLLLLLLAASFALPASASLPPLGRAFGDSEARVPVESGAATTAKRSRASTRSFELFPPRVRATLDRELQHLAPPAGFESGLALGMGEEAGWIGRDGVPMATVDGDCATVDGGGLTGLWTDPVTGISYARNRWYDARFGAFLSEDPLGDVDSPNLYQFGVNSPFNYSDPMGLERVERLAEDNDENRELRDRYGEAYDRFLQTPEGQEYADWVDDPGFVVEIYYDSKTGKFGWMATLDKYDDEGSLILGRLVVGRTWQEAIPRSEAENYPICIKYVGKDLDVCKAAHEEGGHGMKRFKDAPYRENIRRQRELVDKLARVRQKHIDEFAKEHGRLPRNYAKVKEKWNADPEYRRLSEEKRRLFKENENSAEAVAEKVMQDLSSSRGGDE